MSPASFRNLTQRRVPQYLAIYLGAAWALVQFVDFIASHYGLSPHWTDLTLLTLALPLPSIALYVYHHGRPGRDGWQKSEKVLIPFNILVLAIVLVSAGSTTNLSALTTRVKVKDEKGNTLERVVASKAYRQRVALFQLDPAAGTPRWLSVAAPTLVALHLQQQQFLQPVDATDMRARLGESGYKDGLGVPVTLMRQIAAEQHIPSFMAGTIQQSANGVTAKVRLYETATAKLISERAFSAPSVTAVADMVSEQLIRDLDVPLLTDTRPNLSSADITSDNPRALRAIFEGLDALEWRNDYKTAKAQADEAVRLDPMSPYAHIMRYSVSTDVGAQQDAADAIQGALDRLYRLPERMQQSVKASYYMARQDYPRAFAAIEMTSQLYPEDIQLLEQKVDISEMRDDLSNTIATIKKILELDPTRGEMLIKLGGIYERQGDATNALKQYQAYASRYPTEYRSYTISAELYTRVGEHAKARAGFEQALLLKPQDVHTLVSFALLERRVGDFGAAEDKLQQALRLAKTPVDSADVLNAVSDLQFERGQVSSSFVTAERWLAAISRFVSPMEVAWMRFLVAGISAKEDPHRAQAQVAVLRQKLGPLHAMLAPIADLEIYWELGDAAREGAAAAALDTTIQKTSFTSLRVLAFQGHGRAQELAGNCAAAIAWYQKQRALDPFNEDVERDVGRCYRKLGKTGAAQQALTAALRMEPSRGETNLETALLYQQLGDVARAKSYAAVALKTWEDADPGFKPAKQAKQLALSLR